MYVNWDVVYTESSFISTLPLKIVAFFMETSFITGGGQNDHREIIKPNKTND